MALPSPLLARLHRDLAELKGAPYPGVAVFTDDANILKFCLVLTPPSGPWKGLSLHFDVELPTDWVKLLCTRGNENLLINHAIAFLPSQGLLQCIRNRPPQFIWSMDLL